MSIEATLARRSAYVSMSSTIANGHVGVHPTGLKRPPLMSELTGERAERELSLDLRRFGSGQRGKGSRNYKVMSGAYRRRVHSALGLHPDAVLCNSANYEYDPEIRREGGYSFYDGFSVSHKVFIPSSDGGFLQVISSLHGELSDLEMQTATWFEPLGHPAGLRADDPDSKEAILARETAVENYLLQFLNRSDR